MLLHQICGYPPGEVSFCTSFCMVFYHLKCDVGSFLSPIQHVLWPLPRGIMAIQRILGELSQARLEYAYLIQQHHFGARSHEQ
jgi:hypothetical protein